MTKKLIWEANVDDPYIDTELVGSEVVISIHHPFKSTADFIDSN